MLKTHVYVDGFNLYYGALKNTPYKWLNLDALCRVMVPRHLITRINYYTARVGARVGDPEQPRRQQTYLRALRTLSSVDIHLGHYLSHEAWMPLARPPKGESRFACVIKTQEKGSDVNLASHLISDAYENRFDAAVLITNDSDLLAPVTIVRQRLGKVVGVLNPQEHPAFVLVRAATFFKQIREQALRKSQFPDVLTDGSGSFRKPAVW